jgi:hypothetical protein
MNKLQKISLFTLSVMVLGLSGAEMKQVLADAPASAPEHIMTITTDAHPGETFGIDVPRGSDGTIQEMLFTDSQAPTIHIPLSQVEGGNKKVLLNMENRDIVTLYLAPGFTAEKGGYAVLHYLESGASNSFKDFRMSIDVQKTIIVNSSPDDSDTLTDKNQFSGIFTSIFLKENKLLGKVVGIKSVDKLN